MIDRPDEIKAEEILKSIYNATSSYTQGRFKEGSKDVGGLADLFFERINSEEVQRDLNSLSEIVNEANPSFVSKRKNAKKIISYESHPGLVFLMQNTRYKDSLDYPEIYKRIELDLGYKLHFVLVEGERDKDNLQYSSRDMGLYLTNKAGEIVPPKYSTTYKTEERDACTSEISRILDELKSGITHNKLNQGLRILKKRGLKIDKTFRENLIKILGGQDPFKKGT